MDKIIDIESVLAYITSQIGFSYANGVVNFDSGEERDLIDWSILKPKTQNPVKYPLIWYEPTEVFFTKNETWKINNAKFFICVMNDNNWLRKTRLFKTYKEYLNQLANDFINGLERSKNIQSLTNVSYLFKPKYYVYEDKNNNGDVVDAIVLTMSLEINKNCIKNLELCL